MKKKIIVPLCLLAFIFVLAGCSSNSNQSSGNQSGSSDMPAMDQMGGGTPPDGMEPPVDGGTPPGGGQGSAPSTNQ